MTGQNEAIAPEGRRLYDIHDVIRDVKKYVLPSYGVVAIHGRPGGRVATEEKGWRWCFYPRQAWLTFKIWWRDGRLLNWRDAYPEIK